VVRSASFFVSFLGLSALLCAAGAPAPAPPVKVAIVKNRSEGPAVMERGGLKQRLADLGCEVAPVLTVQLTPDEDRQYGAWNKAALESRSLGRLVAQSAGSDLTIGLLTNCADLLGMLAGLQHPATVNAGQPSPPSGLAGVKPRRVGLVYVDAHADFNTPETTLSGMLGGMDVAIASGMCLTRHRLLTGLDPALPTKYIVMAGIRDVDPLEQDLLDRSDCETLSVQDIRRLSTAVRDQIDRLGSLTDVIYVHIDMDVLDPAEVTGHPLTAPEGPTSRELAAALEVMFQHPKVNALGIASLPYGANDKNLTSLNAAYRLIEGAVAGVKRRSAGSR
jgi:arginase family enzyme